MALEQGMITPFSERVDGADIVSYGLQPAGYDARLDPNVQMIDWARACGEPGEEGAFLDPLKRNERFYFPKSAEPYLVLPPNSYMVGWTVERFKVPRTCTVNGKAKAIYTSAGINFDVAGIHPGWEGRLKLHISNTAKVPVKIYGNMGIVYLEFNEIDGEVERDYGQLKNPRFQGSST